MNIRTDISGAQRALAQAEQRTLHAIESYGKTAGSKMVAYARRNHPWHDRTRHARDGIGSVVLQGSGRQAASVSGEALTTQPINVRGVIVGLTASPYYSLYLECLRFRYAGSLSIWWPTVKAMQPEILRAWADRIRG